MLSKYLNVSLKGVFSMLMNTQGQMPHQQRRQQLEIIFIALISLIFTTLTINIYHYNKQVKLAEEIVRSFALHLENNQYHEALQPLDLLDEQHLGSQYQKTETLVEQTLEVHLEKQLQSFYREEIKYSGLQTKFQTLAQSGLFKDILVGYKEKAENINNTRQLLKEGEGFLTEEQYGKAIKKYKQVGAEYQELYDSAQTGIKKCLENSVSKADELRQQGKFSQALELLADVQKQLPENKELRNTIIKLQAAYEQYKKHLIPYQGYIQHIFFHPLIVYPELTFDGDAQARGFNEWFVTVSEFKKILPELYERDFILIDLHDLYEIQEQDGQSLIVKKDLMLPPNKKPLIISVDDINYYRYMIENGTMYKLILDGRQKIAAYSRTPEGEEVISRDNGIVPILDSFVEEHPDFSYRGAKGVLALTGYEGILGYRTDELDSPDFEREKDRALQIVKALKESGWTFASHGYGHLNTREEEYSSIVKDTERWLQEVESLIGDTDIYIYPFGARVETSDSKFEYLQKNGFNFFCGVGPNPYLNYGSNYVLMDRRHIDGVAFFKQADSLRDLFAVEEIIDPVRPPL